MHLFWLVTTALFAGDVDQESLRKLAKLPAIELSFRVPFQGNEMTALLEPRRRKEAKKLREDLEANGSDAERWRRLAEIYGLIQDDEKAREAAGKAAGVYRQLLEKAPDDPVLLAGLGEALQRAGKDEEAGAVLRKAVAAGPKEWRAWDALANHLSSQAPRVLFDGWGNGKKAEEIVAEVERLRGKPEARERSARAKPVIEECRSAYDKAVSLAPPESADPFRHRAEFRMAILSYARGISRAFEGDQADLQQLLTDELAASFGEALPDLEEAARRRPEDLELTARALQAAYVSLVAGGGNCQDLQQLPEKLRTHFHQGLERLEKQARSPEPATAVLALEILACLRFVMQDCPAAEEKVRAAIALEPGREQLWHLLLAVAMCGDREEAILPLFRERLVTEDTARTRFILAKLYESAEKWDEAEKELEIAHRLEPFDYHTNLGLAAVIARRSKTDGDLWRISSLIRKAREAQLKSQSRQQWKELSIFVALFDGLLGKPQEGKEALEEVLKADPDDKEAKQVLLALEKLGPEPAAAGSVDPAAGIQVERIFGPETPTGRYKHPACVTELQGGDLYLVFHSGSGEYSEGTAVYGSRRPGGRGGWSPPQVIAADPFRSLGNAVVWQAPDGTVWLFYVTRLGDTWSTSLINAKISRDGARTWSDSSLLTFEAGTMVRGRPIVLEDGDYLLPVYHETGSDPEMVPPDCTSFFLRYQEKKKRWTESSRIRSRLGNIQPAVVDLGGGKLIAFCRRGGNYQPRSDGWLVRSESVDGGRTWSEGKDSSFPNPNSAVDFIKLRNGHLALFYNDSMNDRSPLAVAISTDQGKTFPCRKNIAEGPGSFAYPSALQTADGRLLVVFTSEERTVINLAAFEESAVCGAK